MSQMCQSVIASLYLKIKFLFYLFFQVHMESWFIHQIGFLRSYCF